MERTYDNSGKGVRTIRRGDYPFSEFFKKFDSNSPITGTVIQKEGRIKDIKVSVGKQEGMGRLVYSLERVRGVGEDEHKIVHSKAGANNLGSEDVHPGDRFLISFESIEGGSIEGVWVSYTIEQ